MPHIPLSFSGLNERHLKRYKSRAVTPGNCLTLESTEGEQNFLCQWGQETEYGQNNPLPPYTSLLGLSWSNEGGGEIMQLLQGFKIFHKMHAFVVTSISSWRQKLQNISHFSSSSKFSIQATHNQVQCKLKLSIHSISPAYLCAHPQTYPGISLHSEKEWNWIWKYWLIFV